LAKDKIDSKNLKLISYQIENTYHHPMDRLESVQDVEADHDKITMFGFPETGRLWTMTYNSRVGKTDTDKHFFSTKTDQNGSKTRDSLKLWINYMKGSQIEYES
jgi:hypothetical protein